MYAESKEGVGLRCFLSLYGNTGIAKALMEESLRFALVYRGRLVDHGGGEGAGY
jgi:hypothetical protein